MKTIKLSGYAFAVTLSLGLLASCSKSDNNVVQLPPIGGYNSANEVGSADLLAYWPLNGSGNESKSNTAPNATVGATFEAGAKGQGLKLTNGYLAFPSITALATTSQNMSISLWAKVTNNGGPGVTDGHPTMLFSLTRPNEWAGNINLFAETGGRAATNDTLMMKGLVVIKNADGTANFQDIINSPNPSAADIANGHVGNANKNGGKWAHYVATWDGATGVFKLYANGQKISNPAYEVRGGGNALPLNFFTPTRPIIGTFESVVTGTPDSWQQPANVNVDEIRVWKKTLNAADINALYELEKAGR